MAKTDKEHKSRGRYAKWSQEKADKICEAIAEGKSHKAAYESVRVPKATFYQHLSDDSDFSNKVKRAEAEYQEWYDSELVPECKRSLRELVRGFSYEEATTEEYKDPKTGKSVKKTKTVSKKAAPNVTAIIFALCNRDPENWQNRVSQEVKGKIETETKGNISLKNVPTELLEQIVDAIDGETE